MKKFKDQFGGKITPAMAEDYSNSPNWKNGKFENLIETKMDINIHSLPKLLYKQFCESKGRTPQKPIPVLPFNKEEFL